MSGRIPPLAAADFDDGLAPADQTGLQVSTGYLLQQLLPGHFFRQPGRNLMQVLRKAANFRRNLLYVELRQAAEFAFKLRVQPGLFHMRRCHIAAGLTSLIRNSLRPSRGSSRQPCQKVQPFVIGRQQFFIMQQLVVGGRIGLSVAIVQRRHKFIAQSTVTGT